MRSFSILMLALILFNALYAQNQQLCKGNLGINIFKDGDFGRGNDPILQTNPNIAPGYQYVTGLPFDGRYTIAKSTSSLQGLFGTWMSVGDQLDPNGYIMIVNANFEPGIFYEKKIDSLCPGTLYEFSADVINIVRVNVTNHILPNVSFLIDDQVVFSTGAIQQNERWNKYGFTFTTKPGQSSVKLSLRNNAPGGNGNDLALDNISFRPCNETSILQVDGKKETILCKENPPLNINTTLSGNLPFVLWEKSKDSLSWSEIRKGNFNSVSHKPDTAGIAYFRFYAAANENDLNNDFCRVYSSVFKVTVPENNFFVNDTICENAQYTFGSRKIDQSGSYREVFKSSVGCDSIVMLKLTIVPRYIINVDKITSDPICTDSKTGSMGISKITGGAPPYKIELKDDQSRLYRAFNELSEGKYYLLVSDRNICTLTDTFILKDPEQFKINIGNDTTIFLGDEIVFNVNSNYPVLRYQWNPSELGTNQSIVPLQSGVVSLKASNSAGCEDVDSIFITVDKNIPFYYSNVISMNAVNLENRLFTFQSSNLQSLIIEEFVLYDRYGNIIQKNNEIIENQIDLSALKNFNSANSTYIFTVKVRLIDQSIKLYKGTLLVTE